MRLMAAAVRGRKGYELSGTQLAVGGIRMVLEYSYPGVHSRIRIHGYIEYY